MFICNIRTAKPEDIDFIIYLCEQHAKFEGAEYNAGGKAEKLAACLFNENPPLRCIVVEQLNKIKGYATYMQEFSTWDANYYMHMDCLYLEPDIRGKGLGTKLINYISAEAKDEGCKFMQWQTPEDNYNAIAFYKKIGASYKKKARFFLNT